MILVVADDLLFRSKNFCRGQGGWSDRASRDDL